MGRKGNLTSCVTNVSQSINQSTRSNPSLPSKSPSHKQVHHRQVRSQSEGGADSGDQWADNVRLNEEKNQTTKEGRRRENIPKPTATNEAAPVITTVEVFIFVDIIFWWIEKKVGLVVFLWVVFPRMVVEAGWATAKIMD